MAPFNSIPAKTLQTAFDVIYFQKILLGFKLVKFIRVRALLLQEFATSEIY